MPIVSTINLNSTHGIQTTGLALSRSKISDILFQINTDPIGFVDDFTLVQNLERSIVSENLILFTTSGSNLNILQRLSVQAVNLDLALFDETATSDLILNQIIGESLPINNPTKLIQVPFLLNETYEATIISQYLTQESHYSQYDNYTGTSYSGVKILQLNLTQVDGGGPDIINTIPLSGSKFNNPNTNVSFDIFDSEGSAVVSGSFWAYANNLLLVSGGVIVCPPASGVVQFFKITNSLYHFEWNPANNFNPALNPVVISGHVQDSQIVPNVTNYSYNFKVWYTSDLSVSISGTPDVTPPYLANLNPLSAQTDVPTNTNIDLSIIDAHTGVEPTSVIINVQGIPVVISGSPVNFSYASVNIISVSGGNGRSYTINPVSNFNYSDSVIVDVYAKDRYTVAPNILETTYTFFTQTNTHLVVSGLQIYVDGNYEDLGINQSLPSTITGTAFKVTYYNLLGYGVNTSGSTIYCNGQTVSGLNFISVSGTDVYDVYFNLVPNYLTDSDLVFHIEQTTPVSGNIIFNEYTTEILWGAQFCYNPDTNFVYGAEIPVVAQATDLGFSSSTSSLSYIFNTVPQPGNSLYAEVIGIEDFGAFSGSYISNNPFFEYGKTMNLQLEVSDYAGNKLVYNCTFKIENKSV